MNIIRATSLVCGTILASVAAMLFYSYQQDEYTINANGQFVSIFDRKHRTINICDKGGCQLLVPEFLSKADRGAARVHFSNFPSAMMPGEMPPQNDPRILGAYSPQPGIMEMPQMSNPSMMNQAGAFGTPVMGNPQMMGQQQIGNPMMQGTAGPQMAGGLPQNMDQPQMVAPPPPQQQPVQNTSASNTEPLANDSVATDEAPSEEAAPV